MQFIVQKGKSSVLAMKHTIAIFLYVWTVGNFLGFFYLLLRITRRVEIKGFDRRKLDHKGRGLLVICNHPSPTEPTLLPFLFYPSLLVRNRLGLVPYSLPAGEYYHDWKCIPFRPVCVPIERSSMRAGFKSFKEVESMLKEGRVILMHPERERIYAENDSDSLRSKSGKKMKKFRPGTRRLFLKANCVVLPVWMDGGEGMIRNSSDTPRPRCVHWPRLWRKVIIKIGEPVDVSRMSKERVIDYLEDTLLELADREVWPSYKGEVLVRAEST